ncbi:hypothetical protein A2954_05900 [Candidatus Roizmanbacteria bacterium RIFCSPLOWO2_01_FULL_37_12]|uniref:Glycosyl transferase family 1 domain-containing protein n=1 Tax=Candidatus Roizmanbacteria bacterium RIFCSPLOWO2_01_FULL_37_12 TaxID=1802056 RepID=A0A1F7IBV7_9BACT|nr:MAG: hypothetical protein A2954_05900 [Candidatus Roizmanbacteria bacterium RIFCSPLOWO2_01_FULL_37_12]
MKIAFFNYLKLENGGGAERFISNASTGLKKRYPELKISVITYESVNNISQLKNTLKEYDVVYSRHDLREAIILKFLIRYKNLKKVIFGFHTSIYFGLPKNWLFPLLKFLYGFLNYKFLLNKAVRFHVVNSFAEIELKRIFKDKDIQKIYNPFDFEIYEKQSSLASFWQAEGASRISKKLIDSGQARVTRLLWVGRLIREKGADDLIKLIRDINSTKEAEKIIWMIAGVGKLENEIKILTREFDNVKYLGYLNNQNLAQIYKQNDLFLSTSRWESFPYTFLEAQTFGLPIIAFDVHGCNEIVKNGVNGYLVNSIDKYKDKILYLVRNQNIVIKKKYIKKFIRKLVNIEEIYKKLYELLQ